MSCGDEAVQATNDDATGCKLSAVTLGYWGDNYIQYMAKRGTRRAPEIHLGYYARVQGVRALVDRVFSACDTAVQVISLGAGFDTTFWRLVEEGRPLRRYIEVDLPGVTARKCFMVKRHKQLLAAVGGEEGEVRLNRTDLHSPRYHLVASDFTDLARLQAVLEESEVDYSCPTLVLAECALVYLPTSRTSPLLAWLAGAFQAAAFVNYEQVNMEDRFGQVMVEHLLARGCQLAGAAACRDAAAQEERFTCQGWNSATCWDMNQVYGHLPRGDVQRVEAIERLDEQELYRQLNHHYCITVARKNSPNFNFDSVKFD